MAARCPGGAVVRARWSVGALAGAFLDLAVVFAFLCAAAAASAASGLLALLSLPLPCTCSRPHLPCILAFLLRYPSRVLESLLLSLRSRFPFVATDADDDGIQEKAGGEGEPVHWKEEQRDLRRQVEEGEGTRAALQRELEKERNAAASATEEAMAMILRLQKEKSALEIELRQQRRTSDERSVFYEDEVEELRDIVLMREREIRSLQKEVEAYRRLLGLPVEEDEEEEEMVTSRNFLLDGDASSSNSVFSLKTLLRHEQLALPICADHDKGRQEGNVSSQALGEVPVVGSKLAVDDDGTEAMVIMPLSARGFDECGDIDGAAGMKATEEELTADEFQGVECGGIGKICNDPAASDNDANIYDVHVVDDIGFSTEVKGLVGRSFSDATIQLEKLQNQATADDLLWRNLNAIKGAQDKIRHAASERRQSLQLELLEDIAIQLQEIKDAADAARHLHCTSQNSKKS